MTAPVVAANCKIRIKGMRRGVYARAEDTIN